MKFYLSNYPEPLSFKFVRHASMYSFLPVWHHASIKVPGIAHIFLGTNVRWIVFVYLVLFRQIDAHNATVAFVTRRIIEQPPFYLYSMAPVFCDCCDDTMADLLVEIAHLDTMSERLTLKRYDVKRRINRFHSLIIRQLPPDIMSTIFEFCLPNFDFMDFQPLPSKMECYPLSLGAICNYWREIAWSTPYLWSSFAFRVKGTQPNNLGLHMAMVKEWLDRSGQLPLTIRILSPPRKPIKSHQVVVTLALAEIINQYCHRWSDLDLCIPQCFYQFFHATDNHAPILRSIRFHSSYTNDTDDVRNFELTCPRLERADLSSYQMDRTNIQWDNLTHLILQHTSISNSSLIMCKAPRLVFCQISYPRYEAEVQSEPLILESLRTLQLISNDHYSDGFLDYFITPFLEELGLSSESPAPPEETAYLFERAAYFFERSACSLRSFSITFNVSKHFERFMSLLPLIPSLKILLITSYPYRVSGDDSWNILQLVAKVVSSQSTTIQQGLLPNLEVLEYTGQICLRPGNYAELFPLPSTDNAVHGPLRLLKFDLDPTGIIPENIISYFLSLTERGLTVNVLSGSRDILQSSIDYYRLKEDPLAWDWVDSLDSSLNFMEDLEETS
jgi:F-box-like